MTVPKNVWWFEVLLYASLTLDALSVAFQDRTPRADMTEQMISVATIMAAVLILLLTFLVWLAAQRRKSWPRWVLTALGATACVEAGVFPVQVWWVSRLSVGGLVVHLVERVIRALGLHHPPDLVVVEMAGAERPW